MNNLDLDAIEARANAATDGPWVNDIGVFNLGGEYHADLIDLTEEDRNFIAHARTDIPAIIARVRELERENVRLRNGLKFYAEGKFAYFNPTAILVDDGKVARDTFKETI